MAKPRTDMRKIREILRQKWVLRRSHREVSASLRVSLGTISEILQRSREASVSWEEVRGLADDELERRLYGDRPAGSTDRPRPDCAWIHKELSRKGVTLQLLHLEYLARYPRG